LSPTGAGHEHRHADAVDLGWKLAAVLSGWGGERLLSSYDASGSRSAAGTSAWPPNSISSTKDSATESQRSRTTARERKCAARGRSARRGVGRMFRTIGLQLGYRYEDSPICLPDGTPPCPDGPEDFAVGASGARAPHVSLGDGRSILDLYGRGFVAASRRARARCLGAQAAAAGARYRSRPSPCPSPRRRGSSVRSSWCGRTAMWPWRGNKVPADAAAVIDKCAARVSRLPVLRQLIQRKRATSRSNA
jgi:hypothetical protein